MGLVQKLAGGGSWELVDCGAVTGRAMCEYTLPLLFTERAASPAANSEDKLCELVTWGLYCLFV